MRTDQRVPHCGSSLNRCRGPNLTMSNSPSRSRGAFLRPGFASLLRSPESRGGRSVERRSGAQRNTRAARRNAAYQALARRLASHNAGRSPLGAPAWRFWAPGAALPSPWAPAALQRRAGALRHASLRLQDRVRRRPSMSEAAKLSSTDTLRSQEKYSQCSQNRAAIFGPAYSAPVRDDPSGLDPFICPLTSLISIWRPPAAPRL